MSEPPQFLVDTMLGKLARGLRMLGYDASYRGKLSEHDFIVLARDSRRIVLTRNQRLAGNKEIARELLIEDDRWRMQLGQVIETFSLKDPAPFSRCLECNQRLEEVAREHLQDLVPCYVFEAHRVFSRCPACLKIYWPGSHCEHALREIDHYLKQMKNDR